MTTPKLTFLHTRSVSTSARAQLRLSVGEISPPELGWISTLSGFSGCLCPCRSPESGVEVDLNLPLL